MYMSELLGESFLGKICLSCCTVEYFLLSAFCFVSGLALIGSAKGLVVIVYFELELFGPIFGA